MVGVVVNQDNIAGFSDATGVGHDLQSSLQAAEFMQPGPNVLGRRPGGTCRGGSRQRVVNLESAGHTQRDLADFLTTAVDLKCVVPATVTQF
jgi:hypothetical protein